MVVKVEIVGVNMLRKSFLDRVYIVEEEVGSIPKVLYVVLVCRFKLVEKKVVCSGKTA